MTDHIEFATREAAAEWLAYLIAPKDGRPHVWMAVREALLTLSRDPAPVAEQDDHK